MKLNMPPIILMIVFAFLFGGSIGQGMEQKNVEIVEKPAIEEVAVTTEKPDIEVVAELDLKPEATVSPR